MNPGCTKPSTLAAIMRLLPILFLVLISNASFGQDLVRQKNAIDAEVDRISKESDLKATVFSIQAAKKVLHIISYQYIENTKGCIVIRRQFSRGNDTTQQTFYLRDGELIYAVEKITSYLIENSKIDSLVWKGDFYFSNGELIDHSITGRRRSQIDNWSPGQGILAAFSESRKDIARYKGNLNGG